MGYPRSVRQARVKCIECNAPAAEKIDGDYVCVSCGTEVVASNGDLERPQNYGG